jgi:S1-C subfamily serine protease
VANTARKTPPEPEDADPASKRSLHHFGTLIQADVHMHEGSGGGPLVNLRGEMVGLCVTLSGVPACETSGMAIPVDKTFLRVIDVLKQGREVEYGFLGIQPVNLPQQQLIAGLHGTRVDRIVPGTPAARYGLREDDIITSVNGQPIYDVDGLYLEVGRLPVEATAHLAVLRNGSKLDIDVTLSKYPVRGKKIVTVKPDSWRGLRVDYPSALLEAETFTRGSNLLVDDAVEVAEIEPDTVAAHSGIKRGMLISAVDGQPVRTPKEFLAATVAKDGPVKLKLEAGDLSSNTLVLPAK